MTITRRTPMAPTTRDLARRSGYVVAIAVNVVMLYVVNNLLAWDILPFLTSDFGRVLWLIDISLLATIVVNFIYVAYDQSWFRALTQVGLNLISLVVAVRMYQVFPFDFSGSGFDWTQIARVVIIFTILGTAIGAVVEAVKLARAAANLRL
ncbi:MAG TPA: hypothetical protein VJQ79_04775 [Acidimicrobiia bacterium]|nr:hypothetical protein [Acidimicrobiia bacterium]